MIQNRRRFSLNLIFSLGLAGSIGAKAAFAQDEDLSAILNVFISPSGKPFRAGAKAPYPVVDWFHEADKNGDGKLDHGEFMADAEAFFKVLDLNGDGVLGSYEVAVYERRIAPEILGLQYRASARLQYGRPRLWLAQLGGVGQPGGLGGAPVIENPDPSHDNQSDLPRIPHDLDETQQGASPFSLFDEPEPVTAADFDFNNKIKKANYLKLADLHFTRLDTDGQGYLTLARLPKTFVQNRLEKIRHR